MSTPNIKITNNTTYSVDKKIFFHLMELLSDLEIELQEKEISICLVGNKEIGDLNRRFFGRDSVTDVLTFSNEFLVLPILGEIVINIEMIMEDTDSDWSDELTKIFIHGVLHLLNYDHINTKENSKMSAKEYDLYKKIIARKQRIDV